MSLTHLALEAANLITLIPDPDPAPPPGAEGPVGAMISIGKWAALIVAVLALIAAGIGFMINNRRGEGGDSVKQLVMVGVGIMIASAAVSIVLFIIDA
jgi:hypothetical protein